MEEASHDSKRAAAVRQRAEEALASFRRGEITVEELQAHIAEAEAEAKKIGAEIKAMVEALKEK